MSKLAQLLAGAPDHLASLIGHEEGFDVPGTLPNRNHNPGDLRHSPHSSHPAGDPNGIGQIDNDADGWADLERQLELYADRGLTIKEAIYEFAPPIENDSAAYLEFVCNGLGCDADTPVSEALTL